MKIFKQSLFFGFILFLIASPAILLAASSKKASKDIVEVGIFARVIPTKVTLGQDARLVIQADFPKGFSIEPLSPKMDVKPFEVRSIDKPVAVQKDGKIIQTVTVHLAIYEIGEFTVPSIPVAVWNVAGQRGQALTKPWPVQVVSVGKKKGDTNDIRPIKGPISFNLRYWVDLGLGFAVLLLSALLAFLIVRRRRKKMEDLESHLPPEQRAQLELKRLNEKRYILAGQHKAYFSELSDILRRYLERRYSIEILEMTTPETIQLVKEKIGGGDTLSEIKEVLQTADLVKFALYEPEKTVSEEEERKLKNIIQRTTPVAEDPKPQEKKK